MAGIIAALAVCLGCLGSSVVEAPPQATLAQAHTFSTTSSTAYVEAAIGASTTTVTIGPATTSVTWAPTTSTAPKPRECRRPYIQDGFLCCMDADDDGQCDATQRTTTTSTTTTLSGFERLFGKVANKTYDAPLPNASSVNQGFNHPATTTTIENITAAYKNNYNAYYYRGHWNYGGHADPTKCRVKEDEMGHLVYCPGAEPFYLDNDTTQP